MTEIFVSVTEVFSEVEMSLRTNEGGLTYMRYEIFLMFVFTYVHTCSVCITSRLFVLN